MINVSSRFNHIIEETTDFPEKPGTITYNQWLKNSKVNHCELLHTLPGRSRFGFTCKEDRNVFLLEFLGKFKIEDEKVKNVA